MPISRAKWLAIRQAIEDAHNALVVNYIDPKAVRADVLARLRKLGLTDEKGELLKDAYLLGQVLAAEAKPGTKQNDLTLQQMRASLAANPIRLSEAEQGGIQMANVRAAQYVTGLGNRVAQRTGEVIINADQKLRREMRAVITDATKRSVLERTSIKRLRSDIYHATGDGTRDLDRIAITEKQTAMEEGYAAALQRAAKGKTVRVFKRTANSCCIHCARLFNEPDGSPRVFDLAELEANGSNVGRKVSDWRPTVGPLHPHCSCSLSRLPAGFGFNEKQEMVPGGRRESVDVSGDTGKKAFPSTPPRLRIRLRKATPEPPTPSAPPSRTAVL